MYDEARQEASFEGNSSRTQEPNVDEEVVQEAKTRQNESSSLASDKESCLLA